MSSSAPYLAFKNIGKNFPGVKALQGVSFNCHEGEVHALMGENGAGKSTLLKILSGNYTPCTGHIELNSKEVHFSGTRDALQQGIAIIYQELHLVPEMTVGENIYLGQLPLKYGVIDKKTLREKSAKQLAHIGLNIDPDTPLKNLSIGQWQMVEIAKALTRDAKVIAFDEPTSSLSAREIEQLFRVIRELRQEGRVIIYVSHRMEEVLLLSDRITIFKDGCYIKTFDQVKEVSHDALVSAMVGRDIEDIYGYAPRPHGAMRLEIKNLLAHGMKKPVSLNVHQGEIVGLFGLVGAGRSELLKAIFGGDKPVAGEVLLDGIHIPIKNPIDAITNGIMLCPEDRKADGIIPIHSVRDNINISARRKTAKAGFLIDEDWEERNGKKMVRELRIKTPGDEQLIMNLSGGNQQKAILGRWLSEDMKVIMLDEPTRGIDVGAKHEIYNIIYDLARHGIAVLFASSDLPEVLGLADRILVMREGQISGEILHEEANEEKTLRLAMLQEHGATQQEKRI